MSSLAGINLFIIFFMLLLSLLITPIFGLSVIYTIMYDKSN
jgi:hypothetical protein